MSVLLIGPRAGPFVRVPSGGAANAEHEERLIATITANRYEVVRS